MKVCWLTFSDAPGFSPLNLGMGVTGRDEADVRTLAAMAEPVTIKTLREVKSVDELDQGHVVPNMGNMLKRGIWFPKGYEAVDDRR